MFLYVWFKSTLLTWHSPVLLNDDYVSYIIGSASIYQLFGLIVATVNPLTIGEDQFYFLYEEIKPNNLYALNLLS